MDAIEQILQTHGPMRASAVSKQLQSQFGISEDAARKRVSRALPSVKSYPVDLLPKRERFLYLLPQRTEEHFWTKFHTALRETNSIYGYAIDGLVARGGIVAIDEFAVISGGPMAMKGQVSSSRVADTLISAGAIKRINYNDVGECYELARWEIGDVDKDGFRVRQIADRIILDGVREWARRLGLASYNSIAIRGEDHPRQVGPFMWDLTGPSYLQPIRAGRGKPGFFVADVFSDMTLEAPHINYFIRKTELLKASIPSGSALAVLVADGFSGPALKAGHAAGVILATPQNLFGHRVGIALQSLISTLKNAAAIASSNPEKLARLVNDLSEIEGAANNLRGVLFELVTAYLARMDAVSIDLGIRAKDPKTGSTADIDVLKVVSNAACVAIECKAKEPGGSLSLEEVDDWLRRLPTFRAHLVNQERFREAHISFELWTTGTISPDALAKLTEQQPKRTKAPISWKDGQAVSQIAKTAKEKTIRLVMDNHFLKHPLSEV